MKDGGTGRRGEMNLSLQKASTEGNRFARRCRAAGGTDGEEGPNPSEGPSHLDTATRGSSRVAQASDQSLKQLPDPSRSR
ncbi:hypothetical protein Q8A67_025666 [Cirrhinus molitorella]|uniref:Uncharacterized protein n=1 Tax=Cirrhinus molitorella TaxID=172907 RepID=A0AA88P0Q8_9TELE|nr:hypothetical protein Q8A67_025666 [Cirrhinus molitorella]